MQRDTELRKALLDILTVGLLRIRNLGHAGNAEACWAEANHLHNLPHLVETLNVEEVEFYLSVEREEYLQSAPADAEQFKLAWERLERVVKAGGP